MRTSVVDVGSNTVRLMVADAEGGVLLPVHTAKWRLRLSEQVRPGDPVPEEAVERLVGAVADASRTADRMMAAIAHAAAPFLFFSASTAAPPGTWLTIALIVPIDSTMPISPCVHLCDAR